MSQQIASTLDLKRILDDDQVDADIDEVINRRNQQLHSELVGNDNRRPIFKAVCHELLEVARKKGYPDAKITGLKFSEGDGLWMLYVRPGKPRSLQTKDWEYLVVFDLKVTELSECEDLRIVRADFMDGYEPSFE